MCPDHGPKKRIPILNARSMGLKSIRLDKGGDIRLDMISYTYIYIYIKNYLN